MREEQLRQKQTPIINTNFSATPGKGSLERGHLWSLKEGTSFPGKWDKAVFLEERGVYLRNASIIRRGELLELITQSCLKISLIILSFSLMKNLLGLNPKLGS